MVGFETGRVEVGGIGTWSFRSSAFEVLLLLEAVGGAPSGIVVAGEAEALLEGLLRLGCVVGVGDVARRLLACSFSELGTLGNEILGIDLFRSAFMVKDRNAPTFVSRLIANFLDSILLIAEFRTGATESLWTSKV